MGDWSLAVNNHGDMVIGFSGSSSSDYVGAYYTGKLNNAATTSAPMRYFSGTDWFYAPAAGIKWGDYSYTSLDPDGVTIWTIQEYATTRYTGLVANAWATRIATVSPY